MKSAVIFLLAIVAVTVHGVDRVKLGQSPGGQPNFMIDRWLGKWYLQARLASCAWSGSNEFDDWTQTVSLESGKIKASETWFNGICASTAAILTQRDPTKGCFFVKDTFGNVWTGELDVIATDYKKFSISYGCTKKAVDGKKCDDPWVTVKTRHPDPSPYTWKIVEKILRKLFDLSLTEMRRVKQTGAC